MNYPAVASSHSATDWARRSRDLPVETFVEQHLKMLELRLAEICADLGRDLGKLSDVLARAVGTEGRGGSRWRPLLTLAAAEAFGGDSRDALDIAVAVELTHTASLVLDDLPCMDDATTRRDQPATHRLVGSAGAILLSVGLLSRAVELLGSAPRCGGALSEEWGRAVGLRGMAGGQAMDVAATRRMRGAARRLHRAKSTALPAFALAAGARAGGAGDSGRAGLESFGRSLGWAYQLLDDARDLDEDVRNGRPAGGVLPLSLSRRLMQRAYRHLRAIPGLSDGGVEILVELAGRVVIPERDVHRQSNDATRQGRI